MRIIFKWPTDTRSTMGTVANNLPLALEEIEGIEVCADSQRSAMLANRAAQSVMSLRGLQANTFYIAANKVGAIRPKEGLLSVGYVPVRSTLISRKAVAAANRMNLLLTPSTFSQHSLLCSGVTRPVRVLPYGVRSCALQSAELRGVTKPVQVSPYGVEPDLLTLERKKEQAPYTVLCLCTDPYRQGILELTDAFIKAFPYQADVRLVLVNRNLSSRVHVREDPRIVCVQGELSRGQIRQLYGSADCFVLPTKAQSFGLAVLEAMAAGLPVIVTGATGHLDFCNRDNAYLIKVAAIGEDESGYGDWFIPDYWNLKSLLRRVYNNPEEAKDVGRLARASIGRSFTWDKIALKLVDILKSHA